MNKKKLFILFLSLFLTVFSGVLFFFSDFIVQATHNPNGSNISSVVNEHWAWNDVVGWFDFHSTDNVIVKSGLIEGYASSSAKELSLDCATAPNGSGGKQDVCSSVNGNYKVLNDGCGKLSGWAWNEVYGWVSFCGGLSTFTCPGTIAYGVNISSNSGIIGDFIGYAWSDVIGWIKFNCDDYVGQNYCPTSQHKVKTTWSSSFASSSLESSTFDTGVQGGAQLNSIMWLGGTVSKGGSGAGVCVGTSAKVGFQIATSNCANGATDYPTCANAIGTWNFIGNNGGPNTDYEGSQGVSIPLDYTFHNNQRYFRYRVILFSDQAQSQSPRVDDIIINWSP